MLPCSHERDRHATRHGQGIQLNLDNFEDPHTERDPRCGRVLLAGTVPRGVGTTEHSEPCRVCGGRELRRKECCLGCTKASDSFEAKLKWLRMNTPIEASERRYRKDDSLKGGVERVG
jgi:hypothetical protein